MVPVLSVADNGKTIDLLVGHSVLLRLPENPSTGYGWTLDADSRLVEIGEKRHVHSAETVGSGGESQWSIKAVVPGATTLRLFTTISTLGTPQDITVQEIRVECFFPVDESSAQFFRERATLPAA